MASAKIHNLSDICTHQIRPTLLEARLMTEKHARDAAYVVRLTQELCEIEANIFNMEETLGLHSSSHEPVEAIPEQAGQPTGDVNWIRTKSGELNLRLHCIEDLSLQRSSSEPKIMRSMPARPSAGDPQTISL